MEGLLLIPSCPSWPMACSLLVYLKKNVKSLVTYHGDADGEDVSQDCIQPSYIIIVVVVININKFGLDPDPRQLSTICREKSCYVKNVTYRATLVILFVYQVEVVRKQLMDMCIQVAKGMKYHESGTQRLGSQELHVRKKLKY